MKKLNMILAGAAVAALMMMPLAAEAQNQRGGGGGGGGFGQGRQGMGMMQMPKSALLVRNDVQKDLKLTDDQKAQLKKVQDDANAKRQAMMEEMRANGGGGGDFQAMRDRFEKMQAETEEATMKVLNDDQRKRLDQINLQYNGYRSLNDEKLQKELGLNADQKRKISELNDQMNAANMQIMQRVRNGELDATEVPALLETNNKALDSAIKQTLTPEQDGKFTEMQGPKWARDPKEDEAMRNRGGRGGRGGGGN